MKVTPRSEDALLALVHLARRSADGHTTDGATAAAEDMLAMFREQFMLAL